MASPILTSGSGSAAGVRPSRGAASALSAPTPQAACAKLLYPLQNSPWPTLQALVEHVQNPNSLWRMQHRQALESVYKARGETGGQIFYMCVLDGLVAAGVPLAAAVLALRNDYTAVVNAIKAAGEAPVVLDPGTPQPRLPVKPSGEQPGRPNGYPPPNGGHMPTQPGSGNGGGAPQASPDQNDKLVPILIVGFSVALAAVGVGLWLGRKPG